jgi:general secretion pathway protein L
MLYRQRMIGDVLTWWSHQMLDLVPARLTRPDPSEAGALLVEPLIDGVRLIRRNAGSETVLGVHPLRQDAVLDDPDAEDRVAVIRAIGVARGEQDRLPVLVRLPTSSVLVRDVTLPLAAEAGLDRVLSYEMDRLTPFSAEQAFYAWSILGRDREAGRLSLRLSLVPAAGLRPLLGVLAEAGASPQAIELLPGPAGGRGLRIPLAHEAPVSARRQRRAMQAAWAGCAVLAVLAVLLPFGLQHMASVRAERRIASLRPTVNAVQELQRKIAGGSAGALLVRAERDRLGDALGVLAATTRVLPDDSFLTDLTLRGGQLTISGQSPSAARLIPAISAEPGFTTPTFAAPVTRIEGQQADLFSIRAGVAH